MKGARHHALADACALGVLVHAQSLFLCYEQKGMETADGYNLLYLTVDAADLSPALMPVVCHHHGLAQLVRAMGVSISFDARASTPCGPHTNCYPSSTTLL